MGRSHALAAALAVVIAASASASDPVFSAVAAWDGPPASPGAQGTVRVFVSVLPGWHINSNAPLAEHLIPTRVRLDVPPGWHDGGAVFPPHHLVQLAFSDGPVAVLEGTFAVTIPVQVDAGSALPALLRGVFEAQACNNSLCLAPAQVTFELGSGAAAGGLAPGADRAPAATGKLAAATPAHTETPSGLSASFSSSGLLLQLAIVFLAGLALNLTPCVYPLIPITIGFFIAQKQESGRSPWRLAVTYVLGMSLTYSALGVAAALTGRLFGAALQSPWVVGVIAVVLLALAASMFGLWEIRVPRWATRASGGRVGLGGALLMGLVVGLVAAPCIGPFVLGLLTYVGQRQDAALGFTLFFALSLGLGLPYLLLAIFTRALDRLPNSGAWMLGVRQLFGVLLIALAGYFVQPHLPSPWNRSLLGGLLALGAIYLLVVARPGHEQPWIDRVMRLAGCAMLIAGVLNLPLGASQARSGEPSWQPYDEAATARAIAAGEPVILDFLADWCLPCKELDEKTFSDARVAARLAGYARFKVNLTQDTAANDAIRSHFRVLGVPTVAFYRGGNEVAPARLTGFEPPEAFLRRLDQVERR